jgi:hypothetical protein
MAPKIAESMGFFNSFLIAAASRGTFLPIDAPTDPPGPKGIHCGFSRQGSKTIDRRITIW